MKKIVSLFSVIAILCVISACEKSSSSGSVSQDMDLSKVPTLINKLILRDAVWGEGEQIPEAEACVAGSQFTFNAMTSSFVVMKNDMSDEYFVTPAIVTSSLNIKIPEDGEMRGEGCGSGELHYLVSASNNTPIDVEVIGESCQPIEEVATDEGAGYPATGTVTAHFEAEEVAKLLSDCNQMEDDETLEYETSDDKAEETATEETGDEETVDVIDVEVAGVEMINFKTADVEVSDEQTVEDETVSDETNDEETVSDEGCVASSAKMFKLVIDSCQTE